MPQFTYVCARNGLPVSVERRLQEIYRSLEPDNITPPAPKVVRRGDVAYGVMNPSPLMPERDGSVAVGHLLRDKSEMSRALFHGEADSSYALFRDSEEHLILREDSKKQDAIHKKQSQSGIE